MEKLVNYKIRLTEDARLDIKQIKRYIQTTSGYRETAEAFSAYVRDSISKLSLFAKANTKTGLIIQGYMVYYKPCRTYLIFYIIEDETVIIVRVLKDKMQWRSIINQIRFIR